MMGTHKLDGNITLGSLAADYPALIPWFQEQGWDFCCGGDRTLTDVAAEGGRGAAALVTAVEERISNLQDIEGAPLPSFESRHPEAVIDYILSRFHEPLRQQFPLLQQMAEKVCQVHGERHSWLRDLRQLLGSMVRELTDHMAREEKVLFPMIRHLGTERAIQYGCSGGNPNLPIKVMRMEHEDAASQLEQLVILTKRFQPPSDACATLRAFFSGLAELNRDLRLHMHLENNVLFPMAKAAYMELNE